jgi:hypothetical protein
MTPKESLLDYLYQRLVEALQTWKGFDDIYGIWIGLVLYEDEPGRPSINVMGCLREHPPTSKNHEEYEDRWHPGLMNPQILFKPGLCDDPWPDDDEDPTEYEPQSLYPGDPEGRKLREAFFKWKQEQPDSSLAINDDEASEQKFEWFLEICGQLIRLLHKTGAIVQTCSRPVPVGFGIGDGGTRTLEIVRDNNPDRISKGMEEWMLGRTYEEIEGEAAFRTALRTRPVKEQVHWWVEALRGLRGWMQDKETTPEWEQAQATGFMDIRLDWDAPLTSPLAKRLVSEAEQYITVQTRLELSPKQDCAEFLIARFQTLQGHPELQAQVDEETISRLHALLQHLYDESKKEERIGVALQLTARALHALRPERFPVVKFGGRRENANRLLEPEKFGLE